MIESKLATGLCLLTVGAATFFPHDARAQNCLSQNPADWPPPARPYFMLVVDTSGSMTACTTPPTTYPTECNQNAPGYQLNSCGMVPNRLNDAKCALRQTIQAFSGEVNFGLATYAYTLGSCASAGACVSDCGAPTGGTCNGDNYQCTNGSYPDSGGSQCGNLPFCNNGPGPGAPAYAEGTWRNGANIVVPMLPDPIGGPPPPDNTSVLLEWFDGQCNNNREIFANGSTPIAGSLESVAMYLRTGWRIWDGNGNSPAADAYCPPLQFTQTTPIVASDPECRSLNIILVTDGDDTCDPFNFATAAASDLFNNGVTIGGKNWPVRTYVINFAGGTQANTDAIAAAGGTGSSLFATNEIGLAQALSTIISDSVAPEVCNNGDDNCNGCVDEGYKHYCNLNPSCCAWSNDTQRDTCLTNYQNSISAADPDGDLTLLPCTTAAQDSDPNYWLCFNPGDPCDEQDDNCEDGIDEGATKCGNPLHCPLPETCNSQDDDCDGIADDGGVCGSCNPSPEVCDGCDNDCDSVADDGIAPVPCGLPSPMFCQGTKSCTPPVVVDPPGSCVGGAGFGPCNNNPGTETCNMIDDDCDGIVDDNVPPSPCVPNGTPPGLFYGPPSQCQMGTQACGGSCIGFIGPSAEICDGVDNDCDGTVDDSPAGVGQPCGVSTPPCSPGVTGCVNGALVCQGGTQPTPEVCDGVDNDCDGGVDETPLTDVPLPGQNGCWSLPGSCCQHQNFTWCPPAGATCGDLGTLVAPCSVGTLQCGGAQGWFCAGGTPPTAEVCDGVDNDCDSTPDDGSFPQEGQPCGTNAPPNPTPSGCLPGDCAQGVTDCVGGMIDCVNDVPPVAEVCNNKDDNCDGLCDNGLAVGGPCTPPYDMALYPGPRDNLPCQPGILQCDGMGGTICVGGVGPSPEVCDGQDNDCDGLIDETNPGTGPDVVTGSQNPFPPPNAAIGDPCGTDQGQCSEGQWACVNGQFACINSQGPTPESCDCQDNDCNGVTDNQNPNNMPPLCSPGKDCIQANGSCQCAAPCDPGEFPCPGGQVCVDAVSSETGMPLGMYCVVDNCGDCATKTVTDTMGNVVCAPEGTTGPGCADPPTCVCKGQNGCQSLCFGVTCNAPLVCGTKGNNAGLCVPNNCFNVGCPGCGYACSDQTDPPSCVVNPCTDTTCPPQGMPDLTVAKPSDDFTTCTCVGSCADIMCNPGTVCQDGICVPTCDPPCMTGFVCDMSQSPPACVMDQCTPTSCPNGGCCDPLTGNCGSCPCEGVICPDGQTCENGECVGSMGEGGGGAATTTTAATTGGQTGAGAGDGSGAADGGDGGVWGLATGGGGCSCETAGSRSDGGMVLLCVGLAIAGMRRRKRAAPAKEGAR